jgi:hypothetical protein
MLFKLLVIMSLLLTSILTPSSHDLDVTIEDDFDVYILTEIKAPGSIGGLSSSTFFLLG